jgi:hypothetical protein
MATTRDESGATILIKDTYQKNASTFDVWQAQFTLRYTFGKNNYKYICLENHTVMCGFFSFCLYLLFKKQIICTNLFKKIPFRLGLSSVIVISCCGCECFNGMLSKENLLLVTERLLFWINRIHIQLLVGLILYFVSPLVLLL